MQQDAIEGCDQLFDIINNHLNTVYKLFCINTIDQTICNQCGIKNTPKIVAQHALSVSIGDNTINSVQDAIDSFQEEETLELNCGSCQSVTARKSLQFFNSSKYLIIQLERFRG